MVRKVQTNQIRLAIQKVFEHLQQVGAQDLLFVVRLRQRTIEHIQMHFEIESRGACDYSFGLLHCANDAEKLFRKYRIAGTKHS